jgi:hypothetical protein
MNKNDSLLNVTVVPAQPGYVTVYDFDDCFDVCEAVIAWRVETRLIGAQDEPHTDTYAVTIDGDPASNCVGVQQPDGSIHFFGSGETYKTLAEANAKRKTQAVA